MRKTVFSLSDLFYAPACETLKRVFDIGVVLVAAPVFLLPGLVLALLVKATSPGPVLYWSRRIGQDNRPFQMPKFRSMKTGTPAKATHLLKNADNVITPLGRFMRRTSLDELPQLWSILKGDMSLVGPRPALFNQDDLIEMRTKRGIHALRPGLIGWAQVNGRDELPIPEKVRLDEDYLRRRSFLFDLYILVMTFIKVVRRDDVVH